MTNVEQVAEEKPHHPNKEEAERKEKPVRLSETMKAFKEAFDLQKNLEERLKMSIAFMRESLAQDKTPRFKDFWETKKLCLELFKEKINPLVKAECWKEYTTLSAEAKRLKDLLEEESVFAVEQIELALQALDEEILQPESSIAKQSSLERKGESTFLSRRWDDYDSKQREVQWYLQLTTRMRDLRKSILEQEMRIRHKSRLLKKLSSIGDLFLPKKKALIALVTKEFTEDVQQFAIENFSLETHSIKQGASSIRSLRESVKEFQQLAKQLALGTKAFTQTREVLSSCWHIVQEAGKEKKKEFLERQEQCKASYEEAVEVIRSCEKQCIESPPSTREEVAARIQKVEEELSKKSLAEQDLKGLRRELRRVENEALKPFVERDREFSLKKEQELLAKKQALDLYKEELQKLVREHAKSSLKELQEAYHAFADKAFKPSLADQTTLDELRKELYEAILLKREQELAEEDTEALEKLLGEWEEFREKTRASVERYRKEMGGSGFDFEKAMLFGKAMDLEKARLDRAAEKVLELEDKLS